MWRAGSEQVLSLGGCRFDRSRGLLLRDAEPVPLRPKAFALLTHLVANAGRVVEKSELIAAVWPDVVVTEDSLTQAIRDLRKALDDEDQRTVRTIARRGYLLAPTELVTAESGNLPVVAVLRFANEGSQASEAMVDGFTEDIIGGLARFRTVTVLARSSSFGFASNASVDWRNVGSELGASFLVRGRIRVAANCIEVKVDLIDASRGSVLWNDVFSARGDAIFELQHEIALKIINRLVSRLDDASLARSSTRPPASFAAYEMLQRGLMRLRGYGEDDNTAAKALFEQALAKDPHYALAQSYVALADLIIYGFGQTPPALLAALVERATRAVDLAPEEPRCHRVLGQVQLFARQYEAAEYHVRRALDLNPCDADTITQMGFLLTMRGRPIEALSWLDRAVRINPIHPDWYHSDRGVALYAAGEYELAIASLSKLPARTPWRKARLAACHAQLGRLDDARHLMSEVAQLDPEFSAMRFANNFLVYEHAADIKHVVEGVEKALAAAGN